MSRENEYRAWIEAYVARVVNTYGLCREASHAMARQFPELRICRGHVHTVSWGKRSHFWLSDSAGNIWDPTREQFPGPIEYEEWHPGDPVRVGKCMNCGQEIWRPTQSLEAVKQVYICSETCEEEYSAYVEG